MEKKYLAKAKIYTIRSPQTDEIYIGSTIDSLAKRFYCHKKKYQYFQDGKGKINYSSFRLLEKYDDCYIELLENYPCNDKNELTRREGELIRANDKCVNKNIPGRSEKQWREDHKERINERKKEKHECQCGGKFQYTNKARHEKTKRHLLYMINKIENENQ